VSPASGTPAYLFSCAEVGAMIGGSLAGPIQEAAPKRRLGCSHQLFDAQLLAHQLCALRQSLQLHTRDHARQRLHPAVRGQVHAFRRNN